MVNKTYETIDERLEAIESRAETINTTLGQDKLNKSAVVNNLTTTIEGTVLDGRIGKTIKDMLYSASENAFTAENTVAKRINDMLTTAEQYADTNKVDKTSIYNDINKDFF